MQPIQWRRLGRALLAVAAMAIGMLGGLVGSSTSSFAGSPVPYVYPFEVQNQGGNVIAINRGVATVAALITIPAASGSRPGVETKIAVTVPPYSTKQVAHLGLDGGGQYEPAFTFTVGSLEAPGNSDYSYSLPYAVGEAYRVTQASDNPGFSHHGNERYAVDFEMPVGTPVHAARSGVVVYTEDQYQEAGVTPDMQYKANAVYIEHEDGTVAVYAHLKYKGVAVAVGQPVRAGDLIGYSGNTGYSSGPHLHFEVSRIVEADGGLVDQSIPIQFQTGAAPEQATAARTDLAMMSVAPGWQVEDPIARAEGSLAQQLRPEGPQPVLQAQAPGSTSDLAVGGIASEEVGARSMGSSQALLSSAAQPAQAPAQEGPVLDKGAATIAAFALFWVVLGKWNARRVARA